MFNSADEILLLDNKPKFFIKYQEREFVKPPKRYSSKSEYENIKKYQKSQEVKVDKNASNLPSYQKPTQNFITSQANKNKNPSQTKLKQQISVSLLPQRSKSLEKQRLTDPLKQYSRIPIEYYDQRDHGCGADGLRGRVIYKGYAPKNSYFFLKTLKPLKLYRKTFVNLRSDFELKFNSKFESGNLAAVNRISQNEFWLFMREDTNTHGLRQWFYFQVTNRKAMKAKFRIYKFSKYYSLYRQGMKPFVRNYHRSGEWKQQGEKIVYDYDPHQKAFFVEFQYQFQEDNESVEFATLPPYTYSMLKEYLEDLNENPNVDIGNIGESMSGLDIPFITISDHEETTKAKKQAIFILARTHPGETVSNFALQSMIERILSLKQILHYFNFYIVPMVNPDGVFFGNHRTGVFGQDLNRNFQNSDPQCFPQVEAIQLALSKVRKMHKIRYLLDLHGHSARKNIFAYTDEFEVHSKEFLLSRILPKLLNDAISSFKYEYCVFRASKQKKKTARVHFSHRFKINAITFEQSYGLLDFGCIGVSHWRNFGMTLAQCLLDFAKIFQSGQYEGLESYLTEEIKIEKEEIQKRIIKHKKMLGIESVPDLPTQEKVKKKNQFEMLKQKFLTKQAQKNEDYEFKEEQSGEKKVITQSYTTRVEKKEERDDSSIASSELSSGDEDLQMLDDQLQSIKKDIVRVGCMKEASKREKYNIADKKLELSSWQYKDEYRLHEQKSSMIPRILKLQMQRKEQYKQNIKRDMYEKSSLRRDRLALPNIRK